MYPVSAKFQKEFGLLAFLLGKEKCWRERVSYRSQEGKQKIKTLISGTTSFAAIYQKNFATIAVPLPPIEIQKEIVAEIAKEQECVSSSLKTVDIFEKKISQLINDIL